MVRWRGGVFCVLVFDPHVTNNIIDVCVHAHAFPVRGVRSTAGNSAMSIPVRQQMSGLVYPILAGRQRHLKSSVS